MNLLDVFDQMAYGELSQIFDGQLPQNSEPDQQRRLVHLIQAGLNGLYSRFLLKEGELVLEPLEGQTKYTLHSHYAESNPLGPQDAKYIKDSAQPFKDDLHRVERVYDALGQELPLNNLDDVAAVHTPSAKTLVIPQGLTEAERRGYDYSRLTLRYRANHPDIRLAARTKELVEVELELPESHMDALLYYVASRMLNPLGAGGEFHEGNNYAAKYEAACRQLEHHGYQVDQGQDLDRFHARGFV